MNKNLSLAALVLFTVLFSARLFSQADLCSNATSITPGTTCVNTAFSIPNTFGTELTTPGCTTSHKDGWYQFTASATSATITANNTNKDMGLAVYTSCTAASFVTGSCVDAVSGVGTESVVIATTVGTTYYIRVMRTNTGTGTMSGNICVKIPNTPPANDQCSGATTVTCGGTYIGSTSLATSTGDPGTCNVTTAAPGVWFKFVGTGANTTASLCGSGFDTKIQVFTGSCGSTTCVDGNDDYCSLQSQVTWAAATGTTYYIFVGGFSGATGSYSLTMTCVMPTPPNCATYSSPTNGQVLNCTSTSLNWTAPTTGGTPTQYLLYFGTNAAANNINNGTNIGNVLTYTPPSLLPNTTYYWKIVPANGAGNASGCATYSFTTGNSVIANDDCGGATPLTSGVTISDDNSCATADASISAAASCWSTGTINSLWYSVNVTSGTLGVLTSAGTLSNTQIALYSGPCTSLTEVACNDDAPGPGCGGTTTSNSQLNLTGLTNGTYYIRVDGRNAKVGTFGILAATTGSVGTAVPVPGQDCLSPVTLCANPLPVGNPGYQNTGNICDFDGSGNCTGGETNAMWLQFSITAPGSLQFNIIPNDYAGCDNETDYDWILFKTAGTGATNCASIYSSGGGGTVACNYSYLGVTGMSTTGNTPTSGISPAPTAGCYDASYEPSVTAALGDVFYLVIQNFSGSSSGFSLTFPTAVGTAVPNTTLPTQVLWTGGANTTSVTTTANWGGCATPNCGIPGVDAIVAATATVQPVVAANLSVKSVTINPGATLTINANVKLDVCGNFINNGNLVCAPGSTVNFNGSGAQTVGGNLTGTNAFANFMVTKSTGTVNLTSSLEATQNLTTSNATSILNTNGVDITVGGDFVNSNGATTFTGINSNCTFIFNGTGAQTYNPNANSATPTLTLNNVTMSHTGSGVTISTTNTPNMVLSTTGMLTLGSGKIITPGSQEVDVLNTANTAVTSGNTSSFVQGNLRRYLAAGATGSFDFPVGEATKGYQLANLNFSTAAAATAMNLLSRFDQWGGSWPMPGAPGWGPDCSATYNMPYLNNGYWTINSSVTSTGSYDITLHNLNYSNAATGWSVAKSPSASPAWALTGQCLSSPVTAVQRLNLSGFSKFATIQSSVPLPVQLTDFTGVSKGAYNELSWHTASETDMNRYELESSEDATSFTSIYQKYISGNSNTVHGYAYNDYGYYSPVTYYRLKLVNNDGSHSYSNIVAIEHKSSEFSVTNIYPNPASNELNVMVEAPGETEASVSIKDITGREIYNGSFSLREGSQKFTLNTMGFAEGSYMVTITCGDKPPVNKKVVIQHN